MTGDSPAPRGADAPDDPAMGGAVRLFAEIPIRGLSILAMLVLTHRLGVAGFGEFVVTLSVGLVIAEFSDLGLSQGLVRDIVGCVRTARDIFVVKSQLTAATLVFWAVALGVLRSVTDLDSTPIALCVVHYVGFSWIEWAGSALRAHARVWAEAALLFLSRCTLVVLIGLTSLGNTPDRVAIAYAVATIPGLLIGAWLVGPYLNEPRRSRSLAVLREALPLGVNGLLSRITVRVEVFVLRAFDMVTGVGLFAAGLRIIESLLTLPAAFSAGALPALTREKAASGGGPGATQRTMGLLAFGAIPAAVGLGLRAPEVLDLLGHGFVAAAPVLRIFAVTLALCVLNTGLYYVLVATARPQVIPRFTALRVVLGLVFALILIPRLGAVGAALGYAGAEAILLLVLVRAVRQSVRLSLLRPLAAAILGTAPMACALWIGPRPLLWALPLAAATFALSVALMFRGRPRLAGLE